MDRIVTATEANQRFSEMLRDVQSGESFVVTSRGTPVAKLVPVDSDAQDRRQKNRELIEFLESLPTRVVKDWRREDLYE